MWILGLTVLHTAFDFGVIPAVKRVGRDVHEMSIESDQITPITGNHQPKVKCAHCHY